MTRIRFDISSLSVDRMFEVSSQIGKYLIPLGFEHSYGESTFLRNCRLAREEGFHGAISPEQEGEVEQILKSNGVVVFSIDKE